MLESYSVGVSVAVNGIIPFNIITLEKGCTAQQESPATFALNKCGVYQITVDASAAPTAAGTIAIELVKNGVLQPQTLQQNSSTGAADIEHVSFTTLVQVDTNNSCRCCDSPVRIQVMNVGAAATFVNVKITINKIC